jgi:hypothetical protein
MPVSAGNFPAKLTRAKMQPAPKSPCRAAAQSNHGIQATPDCALLFIVARVSGAPDAGRSL